MAIAEQEWRRAVATLASAREVALACHVDPDGDALGSMLALREILRRRGARTWAGWSGGGEDPAAPLAVPLAYRGLPWVDTVVPPAAFPPAPEVFVALDCASPERLGELRPVARAAGTVIVVDHHASGTAFGDIRLVDGDAAATTALVAELTDRLGAAIDRDVAQWLYAGLVTDTGRFAYPSATPATLRLGARLMEAGIDHAAINRQVWETHRLGYLRVLGRALDRVTLLERHDLVYTTVTCSDLEAAGVTQAEIEGVIDVLRSVEDATCAAVLKEQPDGSWKVSLRSKNSIDVGHVAERLGGGGHRFAAGFTSHRDPPTTVGQLVKALDELPSTVAEG